MRSIDILLRDDESVEVSPAVVYMGEHNAAQLRVALPARLREGFDYYALSFDLMDAGKRALTGNIYPAGEEGAAGDTLPGAVLADGIILYRLPEQLTAGAYLRGQVEAYRTQDGVCGSLEKSAPFLVSFAGGLAGDAEPLASFALGHMAELQAEIDRLLAALRTEIDLWTEARRRIPTEDRLFGADGTVTLQPGIRYRLPFWPEQTGCRIFLDDTAADETLPEFSFLLPLGCTLTNLTLAYRSGRSICWAEGTFLQADRRYECNVLDGRAIAVGFQQ
ncbi:MAG: hypothetical protein LBJ11_07750 [Oscillospiraceae bacterium]|jgi:hypothetical protein|nr:hypothetical protein [Oscillospiraceae bacterium]